MKKVFNSCDFPVTEEQKAACIKEQERQAAASVEDLVRRPMTGEFVRKGAVGDWKGHFSPVQVQRMLERIRVKTAGSDVMELVEGRRHSSMTSKMAVRPLTRMIEGMQWSYYYPEPYVRSALAYQPLPGDVFIVSYPKCGTTWLQYLVYGIYSGGFPPQSMQQFSRSMPFLERQGAEHSVLKSRPVAIKTHLPRDKQPYSPQARYLYITRNPFDCCVSYYYHTKHMPAFCFGQATFDDFFDLFITGDVEFGDYFDHLLSWYAHRSDPNVLFLTYEDLKRDTAAAVVKIAGFLGDEYAARLRQEPALVDRILEAAALGRHEEGLQLSQVPHHRGGVCRKCG
ncbi:hypothetical protein MTO96_022975 [Rhipicephalus appendiculatus]